MILYLIAFFLIVILFILIFNGYKKESRERYYDKIRWQFDKKDAETIDVVEVTKAEQGIEEEEEEEEEYESNGFAQFIMLIVGFGMILGVGYTILGEMDYMSYNATGISQIAITTAIDWLPVMITVTVLATILGGVIRAFAIRGED